MIAPTYFNDLATSVSLQFMIDTSQDVLDTQSIWRKYLTLAPPQVELNFDMAIGRDRIAAAASIVDADAPAPLRSRNKLELYKGKIPAIKEKFRMSQSDMRQIEILRRLLPINDANAALIAFLDKDVKEAAVSGDKRIDLMLLQAISTLTVDVSTTNNPDGAAYGTIDLLPQSYQKQGVPVVWTDAANAKPVDDIENFIEFNYNTRGRTFGSIKMSYELWLTFKKTAQVIANLASFYNTGKLNSSFAVTLPNVNEYFAANGWPPIEIIRYTTNIEVDGAATFIKGFNSNAVSFTPAGQFGTLFNAISMEKLHPVAGKSYANYGPTLLAKWSEQDPLVEFTGMEMNAFPGINIDNVFVLTANVVQASYV